MPHRSRRALLELLGTGTAALLAGCQTGPTAERSTPTTSSPETSTPTASGTVTDTATKPAIEAPGLADCAAVSRPQTAWPVPRRSPAQDGYVADHEAFDAAPMSAWQVEPSAPEDSYASPLYGQPVVAHDAVYLVNLLDNGPQRPMYGHVHALDSGSGARQWASERLRSPSHPAIWGDLVVVIAEDESLDAMVVAFDRTDGTRRWTREFEARDSGFIAAGEHLYLAMEDATARGTALAIDEEGATIWSREGVFADHVNEGPTVGPDHVYVTTREGWLHALHREDGATAWSHRFEHPTERRPYVTDVVATTCSVVTVVEGAIRALDAGGNLVWELDGDHGSLSTDGHTLYVSGDLDDGERGLLAIDAATGEVHWTVGGPVRTPPVVAGDAIYVRFDERIVALDRADGRERWRTDGSLEDLALADGTLYGTRGGTLLALE